MDLVLNKERGSSHWPPYMTNLLIEVVSDWVARVEQGEIRSTTEHLRVAKALLRGD